MLPLSARLAIACFVVLIGFGYLSALTHMFFTYANADGKPMLTPDDVKLQIAGKREKTVLEAKLVGGSMEQYLQDPTQRKQLLGWIRNGAPESGFASVQPIFTQRCVACHNSGGGAAKFRPLEDFKGVAAVTKTDRGETPSSWARVAHIHLQSLAMVYVLLGLAFSFCSLPEKFKACITPLAFVALIGDFGLRVLIPTYPDLTYVMMGAGGLGGFCTVTMIFGTLYELVIVPMRQKPFTGQAGGLTPAIHPAGAE
jgi:hypothetical protein